MDLEHSKDPFCMCKYCPQHGTKNDLDRPQNNTAQPIIQQVDQPPPQKYRTDTIMDTNHPKTLQIDEHQLAIDKLTYVLNTIKMECEHEDDPIIKEKLGKHASSIKLQLAQVITKEGQIATWDGKLLSSDLGDLVGCVPNARQCTNHESTIIWNQTTFTDICPVVLKDTYMAEISGKYIIIDQLQGGFKLKSAYKNCLELPNALFTYQGIVIIIKNGCNVNEDD
uniref:Uncharacterized protein n=1 Tax=Romanomermis culicivorax TaxID=13658 RepID=A0A915KVF0_ROMCU